MSSFNAKAATRIAAVSFLLASLCSPLAWFLARESAEETSVSLGMEESRRILRHFDALALDHAGQDRLSDADSVEHAKTAAEAIVGGLFDIAEIYDSTGKKLAEATTDEGQRIETLLPKHGQRTYSIASYESLKLSGERWVMRVFVPLEELGADGRNRINGYFEGVRLVPEWQRKQIINDALVAALLVSLASLLCGAVIYPIVVQLSADNARKAREVLDSHISMMEALGRAIAKRDSDTGAHNYRVAWIATRIAEEMGVTDTAMQSLIVGSFLHDVGKIGIADAILLKPGKLDASEFSIMQTHVQLGEEIVKGIGWLDGAQVVVACHHEKWNGNGYPRRLVGDAIPLAARIFAVADVFDALCSKRPYKEPFSFEAAMAILEKDTGSHFAPDVMAAFRPISVEVYDRLASCDEEMARGLLEERVRRHFGM